MELPDGRATCREIVRHVDAVCAAVFTGDGQAVLVRQYRTATERVLLEVPAGKIDAGETPDQAILRELREEIGFVSGKIEKLFEFYCTPGFCDEKMTAYLVTEAVLGEAHLDDEEFLEVVKMSREELELAVVNGGLSDAKSLATVLESLRRL